MDIYEIRKALNEGKTIFDLPLRVTYYARVSTDKDAQLHSLSAQVTYYRDYIGRNQNWVFVDGYVDEGISGTSVGKRESFLRMIEDAHDRKFDFIVTKEISRFSRNTLDSIQYTQELLRCGVGVFFQSDNINTLMPDAEMRLTIMSSIAQDEVRKISERVRFGFKRAIENGVVLGSNRIWGYQKQNGKLVIVEEEAEIIRMIFDLYANQRMGIRGVAKVLTEKGYRNSNGNPFSFSTIRGILCNPKYKGFYCGGKTSKLDYKLKEVKEFAPDEWVMYKDEDSVPPIVSEALWERANALLSERSAKQSAEDKTSYQNKYAYSGKVFCGIHKKPYYRSLYRYQSGNKEVWHCQEYSKTGKKGCKAPSIYTVELDSITRSIIQELQQNREQYVDDLLEIYQNVLLHTKTEDELSKCRKAEEDIRRRKDKLLDLNIDGRITDDEFSVRNERFNQELLDLQQQRAELEEQEKQNAELLQSIQRLRKVIDRELEFEQGFSGGIIDSIIDRLEIFETEDRNVIQVKAYLRFIPEQKEYRVKRSRGNTSVCSALYI